MSVFPDNQFLWSAAIETLDDLAKTDVAHAQKARHDVKRGAGITKRV